MGQEIHRLSRLSKIEKTNLDIAIRALEKQRHLVELSDARIRRLETQLEEILSNSTASRKNDAGLLINRMKQIDGIEQQLATEKSLNLGLNQSLTGARQTVLIHRTKVKGTESRIQNMKLELLYEKNKSAEDEIMDHVLQQQLGYDQ